MSLVRELMRGGRERIREVRVRMGEIRDVGEERDVRRARVRVRVRVRVEVGAALEVGLGVEVGVLDEGEDEDDPPREREISCLPIPSNSSAGVDGSKTSMSISLGVEDGISRAKESEGITTKICKSDLDGCLGK